MTNILTGSTVSSAGNAFMTSLKNGYHNLINSMSLEITNCQVVNLTNFSNLDIQYRLLTTCSKEDEQNFLPSINFAKDTAESISYVAAVGAGSVVGLGECNNVIKQTTFSTATGYGNGGMNYNAGRLQRMISTSYDPANSPIGSANSNLTSLTT